MSTALITGITGQDGSYLAEFLLSKRYTVVGMSRRTSTINFEHIANIQDQITIDQSDLYVQDPKFYRPAEVDLLISDTSSVKNVLGWEPSVTFQELVEMMVQEELRQLENSVGKR